MIPKRVRLGVLLAFLCHGPFIRTKSYHLSYDAYTHMFFADHYARNWFSLWDGRWFGGFEVVSYPPLVHQLIGLTSRLVDMDAAYAAIQWIVVSAYPLAIYAFSRILFGKIASSYAALGGAFLSSIYYASYAFGQLPTLTASLFALFALAALAEFLKSGNRLSGALAIALFTVTMACHHATLLFLPWAGLGVVIRLMPGETEGRYQFLSRLISCLILAVIGGLLVIWPFWEWGRHQEMQTPIDHLSRHNFLEDPFAIFAFFLPMYGALIILFPFLAWKGSDRRSLGLLTSFAMLLILGLGGTTPLPHWLFGDGWEWLTYDRFAFWASLLLIPFLGVFLIRLRWMLVRRLSFKVELSSASSTRPFFTIYRRFSPPRAAVVLMFTGMAAVSFLAGSLPAIFHTQPEQLDMTPIVEFLKADDRSRWRYLTFGFGDQTAYLSRLTQATTIDGSYFTARTLPELRESGIGLIDTAFWTDRGLPALNPILKKSGEYGVRWGFVHRREYVTALKRNGWVFVKYLPNGVQVWENPSATLPPAFTPPESSRVAELSWGILPPLSLVLMLGLAFFRFVKVDRHSP